MSTRRVTRFRGRGQGYGSPSLVRRLQLRGGAMLVTVGSICMAIILMAVPYWWARVAGDSLAANWGNGVWTSMGRVEEHWKSFPHLPEFRRGNEPQVKDFLLGQPLTVAIQDRFDPKPLWIRQGDHLVLARESPTVQRYRQWITQAEMAQRFDWFPAPEMDPDAATTASIVLLGDRWVVIKRWVLGSPRVEEALRAVLATPAPFRMGLVRTADEDRLDLVEQPWGAEPFVQADPARLVGRLFSSGVTSTAFTGWTLMAIPFSRERADLIRQRSRQLYLASGISILIAGILGAGLTLRHRARQRAILDGNRMASLTHSLKTPLAILKFRCDSIRLGRLTPDQTDAELIQIGEEVDHLTLIIESGLQAIRGTHETGPQAEVSPAWLTEIANDLAPVFESENRVLQLRLSSDTGKAALPSLRAAIFTLLENALFHGDGVVSLETYRLRKRLFIKVGDEGKGVDSLQLEALGKPFMRLRARGQEGFLREGQGLGISLLVQVARKEGWGLTFASEPGKGLTAILEIQAT